MKVIIGAGGKTQEGWISTERHQLDILYREDFERILNGELGFEAMLAEHCLEHIPVNRLPEAFQNCFDYLCVGGRFRIAVPDGLHIYKDYIDYVKPGGTGAGAQDHTILFTYETLGKYMMDAGFRVEFLEWWGDDGKFHTHPWNEADGYIERCLASDPRNKDGKPNYTSLIVDGFKDNDTLRPHLEDAYAFVEKNSVYKLSPFNRKKTRTFYELARLAPADGVIVELGAHHGIGTAALWYGTRDGHRCKVIAVDAYKDMKGWANEPYGPYDQRIWASNMEEAKIHPQLYRFDAHELSQNFSQPISLLVHDLGCKERMPQDVMDWEDHIILGGLLAMRDIDDYSMDTEEAVRRLLDTGRWGKRRNWEAFITSLERIK
jgi:predicted SAM-dependent methyltransferase